MNVVQLAAPNVGDVAAGLRRLAERIESGELGDAHNLVWVLDAGDARTEVGLLGRAGEPAAVGYLLLALGQRKLLNTIP